MSAAAQLRPPEVELIPEANIPRIDIPNILNKVLHPHLARLAHCLNLWLYAILVRRRLGEQLPPRPAHRVREGRLARHEHARARLEAREDEEADSAGDAEVFADRDEFCREEEEHEQAERDAKLDRKLNYPQEPN